MNIFFNDLCECGCGGKTSVATRNWYSRGVLKGEHFKYIKGHSSRGLGKNSYYVEDSNGCWIWQGYSDKDGYGTIGIKNKVKKAHRVYYEKYIGPIPEGLQLDHLCRNPSCVNPKHLEPVSAAENTRRGKGTKLDIGTVGKIREEVNFFSYRELAKKYGISVTHAFNIVNNKRWVT